ncbi:phage baseplate assembly protein V [Chromobacterium amazonense]|uniref:phage baseplate assembly protein V n=1 Tax=Chromobacterium amazonense TaxID=1382803 RepID=UPI00237E9F92|nr:phage baseplate assembly protein V [Chromobacterium amazonense]MDE1715753.1 phage baseplate assembly protein V [Chromobacterium amazonense]
MIQQIERLARRVWMLLGRGRTTTPANDGGPVQVLQVQLGRDETRDHLRRLAEYGFTSHPPVGTDAVVLFPLGDRNNGVVVGTNHQGSRMKGLVPGEVAIFDNRGQSVYLTASGIVINGAGLPLTINNAPTVTVNASASVKLNTPELDVSGLIKAGGDIIDNAGSNAHSMAQMRAIYNGHNHAVTGVQGGNATVTTQQPNQQE